MAAGWGRGTVTGDQKAFYNDQDRNVTFGASSCIRSPPSRYVPSYIVGLSVAPCIHGVGWSSAVVRRFAPTAVVWYDVEVTQGAAPTAFFQAAGRRPSAADDAEVICVANGTVFAEGVLHQALKGVPPSTLPPPPAPAPTPPTVRPYTGPPEIVVLQDGHSQHSGRRPVANVTPLGTAPIVDASITRHDAASGGCWDGRGKVWVWPVEQPSTPVTTLESDPPHAVDSSAHAGVQTGLSPNTRRGFFGCTSDAATGTLWLVPRNRKHIGRVDVIRNTAQTIPRSANAIVAPDVRYSVGVLHTTTASNDDELATDTVRNRTYLWAFPFKEKIIVRVDTVTNETKEFADPATFGATYHIIVIDTNDGNVWMLPYGMNSPILRVAISSGAPVVHTIPVPADGITYGRRFWLVPNRASHFVLVDVVTFGTTVGLDRPWSAAEYSPFAGCIYDAQSLWIIPRRYTHDGRSHRPRRRAHRRLRAAPYWRTQK